MEHTRTQTPCFCYDLTIPGDFNSDDIMDYFRSVAKKWSFQKEIGETTEYIHYQCRISLKEKKRLNQVIQDVQSRFRGAHVSTTSSNNQDNDFYATKESTRIDGPWTNINNANAIPSHLRGEPNWFPWQKQVLESINGDAGRKVNIVYDWRGAIGKSTLCNWLGVRGKARRIPALNDYKDVMRMVCDTPTSRVYFLDLPRATEKKNLSNTISAIETIKDGYAFDERYNFKEKYFERPHVWIFTNAYIDTSLLTKDRWEIWNVDYVNKALVKDQQPILQIVEDFKF